VTQPYSGSALNYNVLHVPACLLAGRHARSSIAADRVVAALLSGLPEAKAAALRQVLLVVLLRPVEPLRWEDLGDYLPVQDLLLPLQRLQRRLLLLRGVVVDP
jgi:hypothetical protein